VGVPPNLPGVLLGHVPALADETRLAWGRTAGFGGWRVEKVSGDGKHSHLTPADDYAALMQVLRAES
jgi:hypothetical protein